MFYRFLSFIGKLVMSVINFFILLVGFNFKIFFLLNLYVNINYRIWDK